jgi:DNA-binding transcriptional LysR family regulator
MHDMQLSGVDLNLLVVLDALLDTRSVKRAAARVALSPSATSHALGRLRDLLGDPLLVRAGRHMVLTPRAEAIKPRVQRLLQETGALLRSDEPVDPGTLRRSFRISSNDYAEMIVVRALSVALARSAPGVDLYSRHLDGNPTEPLRSGASDLALGVFFDLPADIHRTSLFHEEFVCVLRKDHPALKRKLTLERYVSLEHVLIAPRGEPRGVVDMHLERQGLSRRIARTVASFEIAPFLIPETDYVLTLAARVAKRLARRLGLAIRTPPIELPGFEASLVWHRRFEDDPAHRWLREQITRAVR